MSTISGNGFISPYVEGPRLSGTPKDEGPVDDSRIIRALCHGCKNFFDIDELIDLGDGWYCEECEGKRGEKCAI